MSLTETPLLAELALQAAIVPELPTEPERFKVIWARDVYQASEPLEFLVDGLITKGSVNLLVGEGGAKKTWALLDLAVCVATGAPWLDFTLHQTPVLIVDEESGERRLRRRLFEALNGHLVKENDAAPIAFTSLNMLDLKLAGDVLDLKNAITATGAGLVIIDALADIMPGADENSVKDVQPIFMKLRYLADTTGAAIFLIHHSNKQNGYRGSSAIKGAVDLMLMCESQPGERFINFNAEKARDIEPMKFTACATWQTETAQFYLTPTELEKKIHLNKGQRYVLRYLLEHGNSELTTVTNSADICSPTTAKGAYYNLVELKWVKRTDEGGQGVKAEIDLTPEGRSIAESAL